MLKNPAKKFFLQNLKKSLSKKHTGRIVLQNSDLTAKYQHTLVQIGQKIPEGLDLQMGVPV